MDGRSARRARDLFLDALDLDVAERVQHIERASDVGDDIRERALELLAAHAGRARLFDAFEQGARGGSAAPFATGSSELEPGKTVGPYRILERLGSGGFGTVYLAEQSQPVVRRVALKVLRSGLRSTAARARFEAERQALARMAHPGIAQVFDADVTEAGAPYFAMEFVPGQPITTYCDAAGLRLGERLRLVESVCRAVAHAHARGVVHRDLKPSNVLVQEVDGVPVAKVIDFGVAKAIDDPLTDSGVESVAGELMGTPAYMSPEQASGDLDLDTRADVYALGALLYELLTGAPPFDAQSLGLAALLHSILHEDPELPSRRSRTGGGDTTWTGRLPSDLDWIAMRCLEKERGRRYPSANAVADDVRRFLDGRAVEAAPPSAWYRARKLVRRHRFASAAAALVVLSMVAGVAGIWSGLIHARDERDVARSVLAFVQDDLLGAVKPSTLAGRGRDVRLLDAVDFAASKLEAGEAALALESSPRVLAAIHNTLAEVYLALGEYGRAEAHAATAMALFASAGAEHTPEALRCASVRGVSLRRLDRLDEALTLLRGVEGRQLARFGASHADVVETRTRLAMALNAAGQRAAAIELAEAALAGAEGLETPRAGLLALVHNTLGVATASNQELERAHGHFLRAYELERSQLGAGHPEVWTALGNVAANLQARGRDAEAIELFDEAITDATPALGLDHPNLLLLRRNRGRALVVVGRIEDARDELEAVLAATVAEFGATHAMAAATRAALAECLIAAGETEAAEDEMQRAYTDTLAALGPDARETQARRDDLFQVMFDSREDSPEMLELALEIHASRLRTYGPEHVSTLRALTNVAMVESRLGDMAQSERDYRRAIEAFARTSGPSHPETLETRGALVDLLRDRADLESAEREGRALVAAVDADVKLPPTVRGKALARLGFVLVDAGENDEARSLLGRARTSLVAGVGAEDVWVRFLDQTVESLVVRD